MAYNPNIPQATDKVSTSQADILANFTEINTFTAIDHVAFGLADAGKHKTATFPQAAAPAAAGATEVGIYAAVLGASPELYINKTATQIPFTASLQDPTGWTFLPSGIKMQWGTGVCGGVIAFPTAFATACLSVSLTAFPAAAGGQNFVQVISTSLNVNNFTALSYSRAGNPTAAEISFLAIGY